MMMAVKASRRWARILATGQRGARLPLPPPPAALSCCTSPQQHAACAKQKFLNPGFQPNTDWLRTPTRPRPAC